MFLYDKNIPFANSILHDIIINYINYNVKQKKLFNSYL